MKKVILNLVALAAISVGAADLCATESAKTSPSECCGNGVYCCGFSMCILNPDGSVSCA
ncbi:MAG: hypothetical protein ABW277_28070 [Longimicrobiaceae bacterium]